MGNAKHSKMSTAAVTKKPYNSYLDVLKGLAIILVVFGHSIQFLSTGGRFDDNILFRIIYSFHMPLFMFLSGAAAAYSLRPMDFTFIKRKFYQLVIPFMSWYVISYFLAGAYHDYSFVLYVKRVIVSPDNGLWFLWALFLNFCVLMIIKRLVTRFGLWSYPLVWLAIFAVPTGKYGIGLVKWHLPFFAAGYLIFQYREQLKRLRPITLSLCLATFPLLVASWHRLYYPSFITGLNPRLAAHGLSTVALGDVGTFNVYQLAVLFYTYLIPFAGIGFIYAIFQIIPSKYTYKVLSFLGLYTLDIYVAHAYFFRFAIGSSWLAIISGFVFAFGASLALGMFVLRRIPILSIVFLGGRTASIVPFRKKLSKPTLKHAAVSAD